VQVARQENDPERKSSLADTKDNQIGGGRRVHGNVSVLLLDNKHDVGKIPLVNDERVKQPDVVMLESVVRSPWLRRMIAKHRESCCGIRIVGRVGILMVADVVLVLPY